MIQPMGRGPQTVRGGHYSDCPVFKAAAGQRKRRKNARRKERTEKEDDRMTGTSHQQLSPSTEQVSCLKKQTAAQVVKMFLPFMEPENSSPYSQQSDTGL